MLKGCSFYDKGGLAVRDGFSPSFGGPRDAGLIQCHKLPVEQDVVPADPAVRHVVAVSGIDHL